MTRRTPSVLGMRPVGAGEVLLGIPCSHGVAVAPAVIVADRGGHFPRRRLATHEVAAEQQRFEHAVTAVQTELKQMVASLESGGPEASILDAFVLMVGDEMLARAVHAQIHDKLRCADWAVAAASRALAKQLEELVDPYIRERRHDVQFVGERLLRVLRGKEQGRGDLQLSEPSVVVAHDLSPADTAAMVDAPVVGLVTEMGSRTSHTAIVARALAIPAVVGVNQALSKIDSGDQIVVDGLRGSVTLGADDVLVAEAERRGRRYRAMAQQLGQRRTAPAATGDGVAVAVHANIELPGEARIARNQGAEGVGLYRTEYLYVSRADPPTEDEQFVAYAKILDSFAGRQVTLRTFDIGGDKFVSTFEVPRELNPMLGLRAVRLALAEREIFLTQLRAMVRASALGDLRVMIPLVSTLDELGEVRGLLDEAVQQVRARGQAAAEDIPLGVMIEVPAAALQADKFALQADFMSIGTNDLVQYTLAIDRSNRALAYLASPYDPSVLRLVHEVICAGRRAGCPVSLCGEMAGDPLGALLLVGLGLRALSMEWVAIGEVRESLGRVSLPELEQLAAEALQLDSASRVEALLIDSLEPRLHDLLTGQPESGRGGAPAVSSSRPPLEDGE